MSGFTTMMGHVIKSKRDPRVYLCEQSFALFAGYYFAEFFMYKIPGFQKLMYKTLDEFTQGKLKFLMWIMFRESAKRQPLDAKILTPTGFKNLGDLKVGDDVIGSDGKPTRIEFMSEIMNRPVYVVETEDGRKTECDSDHLWNVRRMCNTRKISIKHKTIDTQKMIDSGLFYKRTDERNGRNYKEYKYALETVQPVELKERDLFPDPYILGVLLGDGSLDKKTGFARLHFHRDDGDFYRTQMRGYNLSETKYDKKRNNVGRFSIRGIGEDIKRLGLNVNVYRKFIPEDFLYGSIEQRRALLEGLMDTDGTVSSGTASFTSASERLADGVVSLVRSLGGRASKKKNIYDGFTSWHISILFTDYTPFRLERKQKKHRLSENTFSRIVSITKKENKDGRCMKVSNVDGLYVTDDYLLTHNSTIAKIYVVYCIAYRKKRFINWDAYDKGNAESALFDISTWLQTNKRLIADFGQLYYEDRTGAKQAKMKRITEFITSNRVKVKAYSTQEGTRGRIFDKWRPDIYIIDDFETAKTAESVPVTAKIIKHIDELKAGLSIDGQVIFLGNLITETGSVAMILEEAKENPLSWRVQRVDVENANGEIAWSDKYVRTREEADKINTTRNKGEKVVSLEQVKKDLNSNGRKVYEAEMMNNPEASGEVFFNRGRVDLDIIRANKHQPIKTIGGFNIWEDYIARNRYAIGGDTAKGVGRDSCADVAIKFSMIDTEPSVVVGTYESNTVAPDLFGDEMCAHGRIFGECLLAPEQNNTGWATITRLKAIYPVHRIYRQVREDQLGKTITRDLGWEARPGAVESIYFNFRAAYDDGMIKIYCPKLLSEIRTFTRRDLGSASKRVEQSDGAGLATRHFDLLRAACIAWEMRTQATVTKQAKMYKQEHHIPMSEYQGV